VRWRKESTGCRDFEVHGVLCGTARVREARRRPHIRVSTARVWDDNDDDDDGDDDGGSNEGNESSQFAWSQDFNPAEAAAKGLRILRIEPP
jgi:hypothetical protein